MKYIEAEKQIKALSSKYDIDMGDGDFNIVYKGNLRTTYVHGHFRYNLHVEDDSTFSKLPFCNKLYMILSELAITPLDERVEVKKYYVKVYDSTLGYLNINIFNGKMIMSDVSENDGYKAKFTDKEIEQLKQREDIPLDWNKVILEEAE